MNTYSSLEDSHENVAFLGKMIDSFIGIIGAPKPSHTQHAFGAFSELQRAFDATQGLCKSLLVIRVENNQPECKEDASARLEHQGRIVRQLESSCGLHTHGAAIGDDEYAVLLLGVDQCSELIPRLESILSRTAAGHLNGDGSSLKYRIGVARCPIDSEELRDLIPMASTAAKELSHSDLAYQFISRRH